MPVEGSFPSCYAAGFGGGTDPVAAEVKAAVVDGADASRRTKTTSTAASVAEVSPEGAGRGGGQGRGR
jgi:hypothetical protein